VLTKLLSLFRRAPAAKPETPAVTLPLPHEAIVQGIIRQEGGDQPNSVNALLSARWGLWNVGHLVWAGQIGAVPCTTTRGRVAKADVPALQKAGVRAWAGWPTREQSVDGVRRQVRLDISRGMTLAQLITKYAPASENHTAAYIANVAAWTGLPADKPLKEIS
jgi:hypothetical protein